MEVDLVHYEATVRAKQNVNAVYAVPSIKAVESICVDILTDIAILGEVLLPRKMILRSVENFHRRNWLMPTNII